MSTETTVARARAAQDRESQVLAEGALQGERVVSWVRLATFALIGLSQGLRHVNAHQGHRDLLKAAAIAAYGTFSIVAIVMLRRVKRPSARQAQLRGTVATFADVGFFLVIGLRTVITGQPHSPAQAAAIWFLPVLYSIARYSTWQVALATVLSASAFCFEAVCEGGMLWHEITFVVACYLGGGLLIAATSRRVRRLFSNLRRRDNLARFVAPQVVDQLMRFGDVALAPRQVEVTVLFSDIRDFTTLSEKMAPGELLELLDGYFAEMSAIVKGVSGTVNKFIGDGLLAIWGAPERLEDHAVQALKAALLMRQRLVELNRAREREGLSALRIGIGVHTGMVAAGMLGGADQHEYTVIGDAVNVASRIEGLTKQFGVDILASEATWRHAGHRFEAASLGEARVKGRAEPVVVFAVKEMRVAAAPERAAG